MGSVVNAISNSGSTVGKAFGVDPNSRLGKVGNIANMSSAVPRPLGTIGGAFGVNSNSALGKNLSYADSSTHPLEQSLFDMMNAKKPGAPGISDNLSAIKKAQYENAQDFRSNIPNYENLLGHNLGLRTNQMLGQDLQGVRQSNSGRGLLYGGVNAGQEQKARVGAAAGFAAGRSDINQGLLGQANILDAQAINTGLNVQQTQASIQNSVYAQALADMQARGAAVGGLMSGVGKIGGAIAGGA